MTNFISKNGYYVLLFISIIVYSTTSIFSKLASINSNDVYLFAMYYFIVILILGVYALLWQQVLKKVDLSVAMSFKPLVLPLNCVWAIIFFGEAIEL